MADNHQLLSSLKRFPDDANYRIEVSGIETAGILEAVVDEARKLEIPIHRAIATVNGSAFYSDEQLKELACLALSEHIEVIICPGKLARIVIDEPNKVFTMMNWQDGAETECYLNEIFRCLGFGFRGFLVWRKGMLNELNMLRKNGGVPPETIFKLSTFDNNANIYDFMLAEFLGADTINSANGLSLENLAEIRRQTSVVMDIHTTFWQMALEKNDRGRLELVAKPYDRIADAPELARICSPCYFKFEAGTPGIGVYDLSASDWTIADLAEHKRKDARVAAGIVETIKRKYPFLKLSDWGPDDLRVPVVN